MISTIFYWFINDYHWLYVLLFLMLAIISFIIFLLFGWFIQSHRSLVHHRSNFIHRSSTSIIPSASSSLSSISSSSSSLSSLPSSPSPSSVSKIIPLSLSNKFHSIKSFHSAFSSLHPLLQLPAIQLSYLIRTQQIKSIDLINIFIKQIELVNPIINAVVYQRFNDARKEAIAVDHQINQWIINGKKTRLPLFLGVPLTIKEAFEYKDFPYSAGLRSRAHIRGKINSPVVDRLLKAGFIILGSTNTSELCMWMESSNPVYGRTLNPYNIDCTVGGSSGGEGSILGAAGSVVGLGSDVGGSIRMPAFFCGIFGHKATGGSVAVSGTHPIPRGEIYRYCQAGPMVRYSIDLWPLLRIMAGDHPEYSSKYITQDWHDKEEISMYYWQENLNKKLIETHDSLLSTPQNVFSPLPKHFLSSSSSSSPSISISSLPSSTTTDFPYPLSFDPSFLCHCPPSSSQCPFCFNLSSLTIYSIEGLDSPLLTPVHSQLKSIQQLALDKFLLSHPGVRAFTIDFPSLRSAFDYWSSMMANAGPLPFRQQLSEGQPYPINIIKELIKHALGLSSDFTLPALLLGFIEIFTELVPGLTKSMSDKGLKIKELLNNLLNHTIDLSHPSLNIRIIKQHHSDAIETAYQNRLKTKGLSAAGESVFFFPSHPRPAPYHDWPLWRPFNFSYTGLFNVMQMPVTQVPLGLTNNNNNNNNHNNKEKGGEGLNRQGPPHSFIDRFIHALSPKDSDVPDGVPLGIQVVGAIGKDYIPIAVAMQLEKLFGGWSHPIDH